MPQVSSEHIELTKQPSSYLEVAVAAPVFHTLTYAPPDDNSIDPVAGMRLLVPLSGRHVTGYLLGFTSAPDSSDYRIRKVIDVLDPEPLFPTEIIPYYRWISKYYHYPIGEVIRSALPGGLTPQSCRRIVLREEGREHLADVAEREEQVDNAWLENLLERGEITHAATRRLWRNGRNRKLLQNWQDNKWLTIQNEMSEDSVKSRYEVCTALSGNYDSILSELENISSGKRTLKISEAKTLDLLKRLIDERDDEQQVFIPQKEIAREYTGARKALKDLAQKGLVVIEEKQVYRDPFGTCPPYQPKPEKLTPEQDNVLKEIVPAIESGKFTSFMLHGVTGSGKTEVYLRAAEAAVDQNRSVLVLVPEIALATQLEGHFYSRFGDRVALQHSGLSSGERYDQWKRILRGEASIVIGARSAVFAPLKNPGLIVVDEEHDGAYKQEEGLLYQARDLAVLRASMENATVILGSATPSITSYHHAVNGKYNLVKLENRIENRPLPDIEIVDLRGVKTVSGKPPLISGRLFQALRENIQNKEQSIIFLNRRGFANCMVCQDCGNTVQCDQCHISLTLHKGKNELRCHYCGYSSRSDIVCPHCRSNNMIGVGFGTERIEHELTNLFPEARIARLDRDTSSTRKHFMKTLSSMRNGEIDILLGTQMVAKGHHFPNVTLVGVIWADAGLGMPDFRAGERTFQLVSQVTGRAGRGEKAGRVIIQTHQPDHYSIALAREHMYKELFESEIKLRKSLGFPPYSRLINIRVEGEVESAVRSAATELARINRSAGGKTGQKTDMLGPVSAPIERLRNKYRWQLLLRGQDIEALHSTAAGLLHKFSNSPLSKKVKVILDVDPENML